MSKKNFADYAVIDFAAARVDIYQKEIEEIKYLLMNYCPSKELNLTTDENGEEFDYSAYMIRSAYGGCGEPEEVKVLRLKMENLKLMYISDGGVDGEKDDSFQELEMDVVGNNLDSLYDAVCNKLKDLSEK